MAIAPRPGTGPLTPPQTAPVPTDPTALIPEPADPAPAAADAPGVDLPIEQLSITVETVDGKPRVYLGGSLEGLEGLAALCQELIKVGKSGTWVECQRGDALATDSAADLVLFVAEGDSV